VFAIARRALPDIRIILTLHEYLLICHHHGQMVKKPSRALCYRETPPECHECFPEHATADFYLRKQYVMRFLEPVDAFVAPSRFLAERYVAWGLDSARLRVIPNLVAPAVAVAPPMKRAEGAPLRVGFFGQISPMKGVGVLLDAAALLEQAGAPVVFDIHGSDKGQPAEFQAEFAERLGKAGLNVHYHGGYPQHQVDALMQGVDVVVVPSIWWENAPTVIQEAFRNGKKVMCSDIGGMKEAVHDGINGVHFSVRSARDLVQKLLSFTTVAFGAFADAHVTPGNSFVPKL
jgi:glycosyltransferase involved in cell wall biosynthesis